MALISCKECGSMMSDRATECPHCGCPIEYQSEKTSQSHNEQPPTLKPQKSRKGFWIIIGVLGGFAIISVCLYLLGENFVDKPTLKITPEFTKALESYDQIDAFSEGLAAVRRDGKWGYINLKGEEVIPCQFSDEYRVGQFSEGVACVIDNRNKDDKEIWNKRVGFINKKGEWVLEGDFFTEAHCPYAWMQQYSDYLPSFKDGKVAVWDKSSTYDNWDEWDNTSKIILIDHTGKIYKTTDSIGRCLIEYKPYTSSTSSEPSQIQVYEDYYLNEYRDTLQCDNGAKLVTWMILDMNNFPYQTNEKTIQYYIDKFGNSTLTASQQEDMEQHLNGLIASVLDSHNEQLRRQAAAEEEERRRQEEEQRQDEYYPYNSQYNFSAYSTEEGRTAYLEVLRLQKEIRALIDKSAPYRRIMQSEVYGSYYYQMAKIENMEILDLAIRKQKQALSIARNKLHDETLIRELSGQLDVLQKGEYSD